MMSGPGSVATSAAGVQHSAAGAAARQAVAFREPVGPANDAFEREADRIAEAVSQGAGYRPGRGGWSAAHAPHVISCESTGTGTETVRRAPKVESEPSAPARPALLVADDAEVARGQMRKSDFMAGLRAEVCTAVDDALAGTGRDSLGCPWIDHWFGYYEGRAPREIERSLQRFAPEAADASTARQYIRVVTARVRRSAQRWAMTGEITGVPEDTQGETPGGAVLAGFGGMFFKALPGGPRTANAASVHQQLGNGQSLPAGLRGRMEQAFGSSFSAVRLHTDATAARLSSDLHARAFSVGTHVAFGADEYRPGTVAGDALIAHELAHVVQQRQDRAPGERADHAQEHKAGPASAALEHDADQSAATATAHLWQGGPASALRGQASPRLRSGLRLQRCAGTPKAAEAPKAKAKLSAREERDAAVAEAGERLRGVGTWASGQQKAQDVRDIKGVTKLDPAQGAAVAQAIQLLAKASALSGAKALEGLPARLDEVEKQARAAYKAGNVIGGDALDQREGAMKRQLALNRATDASNEVNEQVAKIAQMLDVAELAKHTDAISAALGSIEANPNTIDDGLDKIKLHVKEAKKQITEMRQLADRTPKALERIIFVLRSFLALNAPGSSTSPTPAEVKAFTGNLRGNLGVDFSTVFGGGKETHGFDFFVLYAEVLEQQLDVRAKMAAAGVNAAAIPTQGNAEDYFKSMKGKKNDEVFQAYTAYMSAFFYHHGVATLQDMNVTGVGELYQRPLSVVGMRALVCTGYALLGAHLMGKAGAGFKEFIVAVRATDDDVAKGQIDEGHALAHMTRGGKEFWISNHLIVLTENDGIGEDAVAWEKSHATLHKASDSTIAAANQKLAAKLGVLGEKLRDKRGSTRK